MTGVARVFLGGGSGVIRLAVEGDEAAIRACAQTAYAQYVAAIGRKPAPVLADYAAQIAANEIHVFVDAEDRVQGFIAFFAEDDHVLLENVAVLPSAAGQGIGKALIRFCEDESRAQGFGTVRLYTNEKMTDNLSIYPRLGYAEIDRRVEDGFNRVYFEKKLTTKA